MYLRSFSLKSRTKLIFSRFPAGCARLTEMVPFREGSTMIHADHETVEKLISGQISVFENVWDSNMSVYLLAAKCSTITEKLSTLFPASRCPCTSLSQLIDCDLKRTNTIFMFNRTKISCIEHVYRVHLELDVIFIILHESLEPGNPRWNQKASFHK